jgi:hypothetical protein
MTTRESKRIDTVTIKRIADYDADTSWLGEYSDDAGDFAIVNRGEYAGEFESDLPCECGHSELDHKESSDDITWKVTEDIQEKLDDSPCYQYCVKCDDPCDFDRVTVERGRTFRYFNSGSVDKSNTDEDNRKYAKQDYERMTDLERGCWGFIGVRAEAEIAIPNGNDSATMQTIRSGGLWGIESDSGDDYFAEVGNDELADLKTQLHALGFSKRAIAAAFRDVQHKDE